MASLEEWGLPLAVLGLVMATLGLASLHHRYQRHQAEIRSQIRRFEQGLLKIKDALGQLGSVPLSRELRVLLRTEVLARYERIARLYRRYPDIRALITEAQGALQSEGAPATPGVGPIADQQTFSRLNAALDSLRELFRQRDLLQPLPPDVRTIFERELGERQAEVLARFHLVESHRREELGDITQSRVHLTTLMQRLRRQGPSTPFVKALYEEAEQALVAVGRRAFEPDAATGQVAVDEGSRGRSDVQATGAGYDAGKLTAAS